MVIDMADTKINETSGSEQVLASVKKRLQWLTMEASDEEFDPGEVEELVKLINRYEPEAVETPEEIEKGLERFRAYVDFYREDEAVRNHDEPESTEETKDAKESKDTENATKKSGRVLRFPGKGFLIAAAACLVLLLVAGSSHGEVNADENTGFFHWLKKDKTGILAITSPSQSSIEIEENVKEEYSSIEELPKEYHQYVIDEDSISLLQEYEFQGYLCEDTPTFHIFEEGFVNLDGEKIIRLGVLIYPNNVMMASETFESYDYLHTNSVGGREMDVFVKEEEAERLEYMVLFYKDNKKYFVAGNEAIEFLEIVSEEYMKLVLD